MQKSTISQKADHYKFKAIAAASIITEFLQPLGLSLCYVHKPQIEKNCYLHGTPAYKTAGGLGVSVLHILHCLPGFKFILQVTEMKLKFNVSSVVFQKSIYESASFELLGSSETPLLPVPCWLD